MQTDKDTTTSYQIKMDLRRAAYRRAMRQSRYESWLNHGEGQLACSVYFPQYPKELYEVVDWQPVVAADPALRQVQSSLTGAEAFVAG